MAEDAGGFPHWPEFADGLAGLGERALLGYPDRYVAAREQHIENSSFRRLCSLTRSELALAIEDPDLPLASRLAAGRLICEFGDPRLRTQAPPMCDVKGGMVEIGLAEECLEIVLSRFAGLGLEWSWIAKECPRHAVQLSPYSIGRYPVTNGEFADFLNETGYPQLPTSWRFGRCPREMANHPVFTVTPEAADAYAAWLSEKTSRRFRLPTEAEWEYAAGGRDEREFPWGSDFLPDRANTAEEGILSTTPVGAFPRGEAWSGAADMAGNVEEYVSSRYAPYPGGREITDDLSEKLSSYRITRGGSFTRFRDLARVRRRHGPYPSEIYVIGFRLAEDPMEPN